MKLITLLLNNNIPKMHWSITRTQTTCTRMENCLVYLNSILKAADPLFPRKIQKN